MAGIAAAVTAAREGCSVALVQDRPVLGGNASTEVRVNLEGANGGAHNRFFVESGLAEDLLLTNFWRNPTGSPDHWSALLLELVWGQEGLDLYLDTVVHSVAMGSEDGSIESVEALTLAAERRWTFRGRVFVDATGDGTIAYLAGAEYMYGEEARSAFAEPLAPERPTTATLGGTIQFMCKDTGRQVEFPRPAFARQVSRAELRVNRNPDVWQQRPVLGGFWWIEYGGELDTIRDNPEIKRLLLSEVFGIWHYVKTSEDWRQRNATLDLEWVGTVVGKRESRRIIGDYVLTENDIMNGSRFEDAVAFGGWSIDRHAPRGFMDFDTPPCVQVHPPCVYQIPLRCLYARDLSNLYLAGRDISCSHVACCSSRVMLTCMHVGEAVGVAAAMSAEGGHAPRDLAREPYLLRELRIRLERRGHYVPFVKLEADRLPSDAEIRASSEGGLSHALVTDLVDMQVPRMLSIPIRESVLSSVALWFESDEPFNVRWRLHEADHRRETWLPGPVVASGNERCAAAPTGAWVDIPVRQAGLAPGYVHLAFATDPPGVRLGVNNERRLGPLSWRYHVRDFGASPMDRRWEKGWWLPSDFESFGDNTAFVFSYWRRDERGWGAPPGPSIAYRVAPEQIPGPAAAVREPFERPTVNGIHAWVSERTAGRLEGGKYCFDTPQWLEVKLPDLVPVESVDIFLDSDLDRHLANIWYCHPPGVRAMPTLVSDFTVAVLAEDGSWQEVAAITDNYLRRRTFRIGRRIGGVRVDCFATHGEPYATVMDLRLRRAER